MRRYPQRLGSVYFTVHIVPPVVWNRDLKLRDRDLMVTEKLQHSPGPKYSAAWARTERRNGKENIHVGDSQGQSQQGQDVLEGQTQERRGLQDWRLERWLGLRIETGGSQRQTQLWT